MEFDKVKSDIICVGPKWIKNERGINVLIEQIVILRKKSEAGQRRGGDLTFHGFFERFHVSALHSAGQTYRVMQQQQQQQVMIDA